MNFKPFVWMCFAVLLFYIITHISCCGRVQNVDDPTDCDAACQNLLDLGCDASAGSSGSDEIWGTADDISCIDVCIGIVESGGDLQLECTIDAQSCSEVDVCFE